MSITLLTDGSITERKRFGQWRPRLSPTESRTVVLVDAYQQIAEARPPKLREIIEKAEAVRRFAKLRRDKALEADALAIKARATTRLNALKRQGDSASSA